MKILFTIDSFGSGGKERRLTELMKMLKLNRDIQFELVIMDNNVHYKEVLDLDIKIHYIVRKIKKDPFIFYAFYTICRTFQPDIVHCWDSMTAIYAIPACKFLGIKLFNGMVVNAPHNLNIFSKNGMRARLTFPFSDAIIGNSWAGLTAYKAPTGKRFCIYNGFNFNRINNLAKDDIIRSQLNINTQYIIGMVVSIAPIICTTKLQI